LFQFRLAIKLTELRNVFSWRLVLTSIVNKTVNLTQKARWLKLIDWAALIWL